MFALIMFGAADVSMKSPTFEGVMTALLERSSDPLDREVCVDALTMNSLWVPQTPESRKDVVLAGLWSVLEEQLESGVHNGNLTAIFQIRQLRAELLRHCYSALTRQLPELVGWVRRQESARRVQTAVLRLLDEPAVSRDEVRADVRQSVAAGEVELAFDTMCHWMLEDQVEIEPGYYPAWSRWRKR